MPKPLISNKLLNQLRVIVAGTMDYKCDIDRAVSAGETVDDYGNPVVLPADWQPHLSDVPCNYLDLAGAGEKQNLANSFVAGRYQIMVPRTTDVETTDRIAAIRDRDGLPVDSKVSYYEIKQKVNAPTHLLLILESVD